MQYGEVIRPVEGMKSRPGIIFDADTTVLALECREDRQAVLDAAKRLGGDVVFLTTRSAEEIQEGRLLGGAARVYQQGEDRSAAVRKAMELLDVTQAVLVGDDLSAEGHPVSYLHRSEVFSIFPAPEMSQA